MTNQLAAIPAEQALPPIATGEASIFSNMKKFQEVQQMAEFLSYSDLVPQAFKGKPANCLIALSMADRIQADPMMVMQNLYVVHGKPAWSSQFLIACVNNCGRFSSLQYEFFGEPGCDDRGCYAYATELSSGEVVKGPSVSMKMAKDEGWSSKNGSKWKTMPELMLTYRAAAFFVRTKAPEISMGMKTEDEERDMGKADVVSTKQAVKSLDAEVLGEAHAIIENNAAPVDMVNFYKQSIDSCGDLASLEQCGADIGESADQMTPEQHQHVRAYYASKLKQFKN